MNIEVITMVKPGQKGYIINHRNYEELSWQFPSEWLKGLPDIVECTVGHIECHHFLGHSRVFYSITLPDSPVTYMYSHPVFPTQELALDYAEKIMGKEIKWDNVVEWYDQNGYAYEFKHSYAEVCRKFPKSDIHCELFDGTLTDASVFELPTSEEGRLLLYKCSLVKPGTTGYFVNWYSQEHRRPGNTKGHPEFLRSLSKFVECKVEDVYMDGRYGKVQYELSIEGHTFTTNDMIFPSMQDLNSYVECVGYVHTPRTEIEVTRWLREHKAYVPYVKSVPLSLKNTALVQPGEEGIVIDTDSSFSCKVLDVYCHVDLYKERLVYTVEVGGKQQEYKGIIFKSREQYRDYCRTVLAVSREEKEVVEPDWIRKQEGSVSMNKGHAKCCDEIGFSVQYKVLPDGIVEPFSSSINATTISSINSF